MWGWCGRERVGKKVSWEEVSGEGVVGKALWGRLVFCVFFVRGKLMVLLNGQFNGSLEHSRLETS